MPQSAERRIDLGGEELKGSKLRVLFDGGSSQQKKVL